MRHWRALGGSETDVSLDDARTVVEAMRAGEPTAKAAFTKYRADLATGLANLVTFYNPSLIVLGGGLSRTPEIYEGLEAAVDSSTLPATRGLCKIVQSSLDADCAATGAAWLVFAEQAEAEPAGGLSSSAAEVEFPADDSRYPWCSGHIVSVGLTCMDSTMWVGAHPVADTKSVAQRSMTCGGGNAANSMVAASRLRAPNDPPVRLITKIGVDPYGDALLAELKRGIDTRWVARAKEGEATPTSVILVNGSSRTIVHDPGLMASAPLQPGEVDVESALSVAKLLHLDGRHPALALHAAKCASSAEVPILLDCERPREGLTDLLALATYVVSSADFPQKLNPELKEDKEKAEYVLSLCPNAKMGLSDARRTWVPCCNLLRHSRALRRREGHDRARLHRCG